MIEVTKAQFLKHVVGVMVAIGMSPMPSKIIRKETCLRTRGPLGLLKDHGPKRHPNI
jgi:hypothetical protein